MKLGYLASAIPLFLACAAASAQPAGPGAEYKIAPDQTQTSPDGATTIEQYHKSDANDDWTWQVWARAKDNTATLLKPEGQDYPAGFRFTNDSQWLVRMQKTGSGEASLYLYQQGSQGFESATKKPLSDLAWAFFYSRPESRKVRKPDFHISVDLVKGVDDNYRWMGESWPDNRFIVLSLTGEVEPDRHHGQIRAIHGWRCRYDLQSGKFDVPPDFAQHNREALVPD